MSDLASMFQAALLSGQAAWPDLGLPAEVFVRHLATHVAAGPDPDQVLGGGKNVELGYIKARYQGRLTTTAQADSLTVTN